ncbi:hypothetical protein GALMADRAFT_65801 [Galerina marginata CBS 339.88]|uniref:Uncharacterized protein n=1 Tax=Galerina marginata (strain CBS 339.88) TaxID=685588 RepID=A0A067TCA0_GALM3|nr:hypothetical protein GALMADRAFT_65801 [Galerina marginata CBS 339.88]
MHRNLPRQSNKPRRVRCKCKSHCTVLNPITGRYEGDGQLVSRGTRDNHTQDDKRLVINAPAAAPTPVANPGENLWSSRIHAELDTLKDLVIDLKVPLVFRNKPEDHGVFRWPTEVEIIIPNHGVHSLTQHRVNREFLFTENRICQLVVLLSDRYGQDDQAKALLDRLFSELGHLTRQKEVQWTMQRGSHGLGKPFVNTEIFIRSAGLRGQTPVMRVATVLSLVMECIYFVPRRAIRVLLGGFRSFLRVAGALPLVIESVPVDPRPGHSHFQLDPITRQFIVCTSCHFLYPFIPGNNPNNEESPFALTCDHQRTPESPVCRNPLWKSRDLGGGHTQLVPFRKYLHQVLKSWVGRLISRKGIEDLLDSPFAGNGPANPDNAPVDDILRSRIFQELTDASGQPFFPAPGKEGRLVFSLSVDGFNPFGNKTAKQTVSSTGIWLVLLNFPQHLRYLPENMYLAGVVPDKPSKEDIYPYVKLVVSELLEFWNDGVTFSRTFNEIYGRLFKAMLVPVVCDMPAARQVIGLGAATAHNFCTFCDLDIDDINVLDRAEWPEKDLTHIRHIAELWRDAPSEQHQTAIFDAYGIRWSPLHDLPYWNIVKYTIIDPMHALDLNNLQNHCRSVFQIDISVPGGDGLSEVSHQNQSIGKELLKAHEKCVQLIRRNDANLLDQLVVHPRSVLYKTCVDNDILAPNHALVVGIKWVLAKNIVAWVRSSFFTLLIHQMLKFSPFQRQQPEYNDVKLVPMSGNTGNHPITTGVEAGLSRVLQHLLNTENQDESREKAYSQGTAAIFVYICDLLEIEHGDIDKTKRNAKHVLYDRIIDLIDDDLLAFETLQQYLPDHSPSHNRPVLGKDVMTAIWSDMSRTKLPTWITPAPPNWGTAERGKLSADNWRVICTIHLPITLIRLWANDTPRKRDLLCHYMDLVAAVCIANMRVTTENQIQEYNKHMGRYVQNLSRLFPDQNLKPTHHAALHIGDMLGLFGPNHSHSGPHYERYINFFHRINTNSKLGELESTFLRASARNANLRALLSEQGDLQQSLRELTVVMNSIESEDIRGFRLASILDPYSPTFTSRSGMEDLPLSNMQKTLLSEVLNLDADHMPRSATFLKEISSRGVCYGTSGSSTHRNSSIIFKEVNQASESYKAGIVDQIFRYSYPAPSGLPNEAIFFYLQELAPIDSQLDPYRQFGPFGGFLCKKTDSRIKIISISQLVSHFTLTEMAGGSYGSYDGLIHVMPVDRVSSFLCILLLSLH